MDAESKLAAAEQVLETAGWQKLPHWETSPEALIQIGHRLLEAGGYANYIRAADLATALQAAYWGATAVQMPPEIRGAAALKKEGINIGRNRTRAAAMALAHYSWDVLRAKVPQRIEALWQRAPLLAILGSWFSLGFVGGILSFLGKAIWPKSWIVAASDFGFQIWALGFLAIVGFGFWARVRRPKR
jgi:hypothetical protein